MDKSLIVLFGAPGCGKGYLSNKLIEALKEKVPSEQISYISTGDLIRAEIANESETGLQIKELVQTGQLVPDSIVDTLMLNAISATQSVKILDGYPRTLSQLNFLREILKGEKITVLTVFIDTPEDVIISRVQNRRVCKICKKTHTISDGCCPYCGGESTIRKDDAAIHTRLEEYKKNTLPLWLKIDCIGHSLHINGLHEAECTAKAIVSLLF